MDIIIYGSLHGAAKRYADGLAEMTGIKVLDYKKAKSLDPYKRVIYIGSIYAGGVTGLKITVARLVPGQEFFLVTVGMVNPTDKAFFEPFREALKQQIPSPFFDGKKIFHLRGAIDYSGLELKYRLLMKMMYSMASKTPEDQRTAEMKAVLATYGQKVDYVDLSTLAPIAGSL